MGESFDIDSGRESSAGKQLITALLDFACTDTSGSKSIDSRVSSLTLHSMVKAPVGNSNSQFTPQILKQKQHFIVMKITFPQPPPVIPPSTSHTHTQVLLGSDCPVCSESDLECCVRDVLYQKDWGGDYECGSEGATFQ